MQNHGMKSSCQKLFRLFPNNLRAAKTYLLPLYLLRTALPGNTAARRPITGSRDSAIQLYYSGKLKRSI
jgi:hypothetical protein